MERLSDERLRELASARIDERLLARNCEIIEMARELLELRARASFDRGYHEVKENVDVP